MMKVTEIRGGVFRVELTENHREDLDRSVKGLGMQGTGVLAVWIASGMTELAWTEADKQAIQNTPVDSLSDADDESF